MQAMLTSKQPAKRLSFHAQQINQNRRHSQDMVTAQMQANLFKTEKDKLTRALVREIGEETPLSKVVDGGGDWKGRAQQITLLKAKISDLQQAQVTCPHCPFFHCCSSFPIATGIGILFFCHICLKLHLMILQYYTTRRSMAVLRKVLPALVQQFRLKSRRTLLSFAVTSVWVCNLSSAYKAFAT